MRIETGQDTTRLVAVASALEGVLRARSPALDSGTAFVRKLARRVSRELGLDRQERLMVDICARVRDIGMIGLPDSLLLSAGPLSPADWVLINGHPDRGAELLQSFPDMADVAALVRTHHERWDGEGYPEGLRGEEIPLASRIVAVCDAFVAIACDRPHRRGAGAEGALDYIVQERGSQFDPAIVDCLATVITGNERGEHRSPANGRKRQTNRLFSTAPRAPQGADDLLDAVADLDVIPVVGTAGERALAVASSVDPFRRGKLVSAVESDVGLTVAILRLGQRVNRTAPASVSAAVSDLAVEDVHAAISALPRLSFPWQTHLDAALLRYAVHAQAVARSTDRLANMLRPFDRDELVTAALIHDVGKLLMARIWPDFAGAATVRHTPEELVSWERRELGYDHATLGGLLAERWGLPFHLVTAVSAHHSAEHDGEPATFVRLADTVVHHAHGDAVDRHLMLRLAGECGVRAGALRDLVFDLPHPGGSARRRAERSPLSGRETTILQLLAEGKRSGEIAQDLQLTESTIRSHLHKTYAKLEVPDRAQAVLKAAEMAWI